MHVGSALLWGGDYDGALVEVQRALAMAPNLAAAHAILGAARQAEGGAYGGGALHQAGSPPPFSRLSYALGHDCLLLLPRVRGRD